MRFFKHIGTFNPIGALDIAALLLDLAAHPELWNQDTIRTEWEHSPHHAASDILLRFFDRRPPGGLLDYATTLKRIWAPTSVLSALQPSFFDVLDDFLAMVRWTTLGSVVLARLPPGGMIGPHTDRNEPAEKLFPAREVPCLWYDRYQIVMQGSQHFICGDEAVTMAAGEVWWFDNSAEHSVMSLGPVDRIALIVDVRGNPPMSRVGPSQWSVPA